LRQYSFLCGKTCVHLAIVRPIFWIFIREKTDTQAY
jgi:hypothetical protein